MNAAQIPLNDILQTSPNAASRLRYLGEGVACLEMFYPERSATGGLTNSGKGTWKVRDGKENIKLADEQIAAWIKTNNL